MKTVCRATAWPDARTSAASATADPVRPRTAGDFGRTLARIPRRLPASKGPSGKIESVPAKAGAASAAAEEIPLASHTARRGLPRESGCTHLRCLRSFAHTHRLKLGKILM